MFNRIVVFFLISFFLNLACKPISHAKRELYQEINKEIYSYKKKHLTAKKIKQDSLTLTYVFFKEKEGVHSLQIKLHTIDTLSANTYFFLDGHIAKILLYRNGKKPPHNKLSSYYFNKGKFVWKKEKFISTSNFMTYFLEGETYYSRALKLRNNKVINQ